MPGPNTPKTIEEWLASLEAGVQFFQGFKDNALGPANDLAFMDGGGAAVGLEVIEELGAYFDKVLKIPNLQPAHLALGLTTVAEDVEVIVRLRVDAVLSEQEIVTENATSTSRTVRSDRVYVGLGGLLQLAGPDELLGAGAAMTNRGASCTCGPACQLDPGSAGFRPATGAKVRQTLRSVSRVEEGPVFVERSTLEHEAAVSGEPVITATGQCPDEQTALGNQGVYHYMRIRVKRTAAAKATVELGWFEEKDVYTAGGSSTTTKWLNTIVHDVPVPEADGVGGLLLVAREDNVGNTYVDWISASIDPDTFPAPFPPIAKTANCPLPPAHEGEEYEETLDPLEDFQGDGCGAAAEAGPDSGLDNGLRYIFAEHGMSGFGKTGLFDPRCTQGGRKTAGYGQQRRSGGKGGEAIFGGHGGASGANGNDGSSAPVGSLTNVRVGEAEEVIYELEYDLDCLDTDPLLDPGCRDGCPPIQTATYETRKVTGAVNLIDPTNRAYWGGVNFQGIPCKFEDPDTSTPWTLPGKWSPIPAGMAGVYKQVTWTPCLPYPCCPNTDPAFSDCTTSDVCKQIDAPANTAYDTAMDTTLGSQSVGATPAWGQDGGPSDSRGGGGAGLPPGGVVGPTGSGDPIDPTAFDAPANPGSHPVGVGGRGAVLFTYNAIWNDDEIAQELFRPSVWNEDHEFVFDVGENVTPGTPVIIECWGGGGSGGVGVLTDNQGTGGGGGAYTKSTWTGLTDELLTVHIGRGGVALWDLMLEEWVVDNGGDSWVAHLIGDEIQADPGYVPGAPCEEWTWEVLGLPPGFTVDPATGKVTGAPAPGTAGTYEITITVKNRTFKSQPKKCPFLIFRETDSRTAKSRGGGRDLLLYGTEGGRVNVPDAIQDFTSDASMEEKIIFAVRSKAYAPLGTDGEMVLRRLYIEGVHKQAATFWVLPIIDGQPMRDLRARVQLPAPPAGTSSRFHRWIPIYQEQEGYTTGVRCQVATVYIEITDPVDEVNLQAGAWAHEPLDLARMRRAGELESTSGGGSA